LKKRKGWSKTEFGMGTLIEKVERESNRWRLLDEKQSARQIERKTTVRFERIEKEEGERERERERDECHRKGWNRIELDSLIEKIE